MNNLSSHAISARRPSLPLRQTSFVSRTLQEIAAERYREQVEEYEDYEEAARQRELERQDALLALAGTA